MPQEDYTLPEPMPMPDYSFPIKGNHCSGQTVGSYVFRNHWHSHIELLYFIRGEALIECNSKPIYAQKGDLIVINSNELHQGKCLSPDLLYYYIIADTSLLSGQPSDLCDTKYIIPICQNKILFKNKISNDKDIDNCIRNMIEELETKEYGFELAIKSYLYQLILLLLRRHVKQLLTEDEYLKRKKNLERFNPVFQYIDNNFYDKISIEELARIANLSRYHFSRLFKELTNKTPSEYLNQVRVDKAEALLKYSDMNVTEVALSTGFSDPNYFSRVYKKYKNVSPSSVQKQKSV